MSSRGAGGGHERWEDDAAAYALNALDGPELRPFEQHLSGCERCRAEVAAMRQTVRALPAGQTAMAPPPELKQRVMSTVRAEAEQEPVTQEAARRGRKRPRILIGPRWIVPGFAAAAALAIAIVVVLGVLVLGRGSARTYAATVYAPGASASLRRSGDTAQLAVRRLPPPPPGRIYEVWLQRQGRPPAPTRSLFTTSTGSVPVQGNVRGVQAVLVTAEPRPSGSLAPTRPPLIVVRLA